jgi:hypothetical protein
MYTSPPISIECPSCVAANVVPDPVTVADPFVTDTVPLFRLDGRPARERVGVLPCAALFADAIRHELAG